MRMILCAALIALLPAAASAQYRPAPLYGQQQQPAQPRSTYSYDAETGNSYSTHRQSNGTTQVYGNNLQNGSTWNTTIRPNGNQTGTDAQGNMWTYDRRSGAYMNSNGTTCIGTGALRTCN